LGFASVEPEKKDFYTRCCDFFGFVEYPFHASPSPRYLYFTDQYRIAYRRAVYSVDSGSGFAAIWGSMGLGKTSLAHYMWQILPEIRPNWDVFFIESAGAISSFTDTYRRVIDVMGGNPYRNMTHNEQLLKNLLMERVEKGIRTVILVDELQEAPVNVMKAFRVMSNMETPTSKMLQFIMFGSEEVFKKMDKVPAFRDRLVFATSLSPFDFQDTKNMIRFRLRLAGVEEPMFTDSQVEEIFLHSLGIPRYAVLICSNVLQVALDKEERRITDDTVRQAIDLYHQGVGVGRNARKSRR